MSRAATRDLQAVHGSRIQQQNNGHELRAIRHESSYRAHAARTHSSIYVPPPCGAFRIATRSWKAAAKPAALRLLQLGTVDDVTKPRPVTTQGTIVAIECPSRRLFGLQYHPEVVHSKNGVRTLKQFLFEVARIPADWKMSNVLDEEMAKIAAVVRAACRSVIS